MRGLATNLFSSPIDKTYRSIDCSLESLDINVWKVHVESIIEGGYHCWYRIVGIWEYLLFVFFEEI